MNKYEAILMFYPDVEAEKREAHFERLKNVLSEGGNISNIDEWGSRKLAYEIQYYKEAFYTLVEFEAEPATIKEFDRVAKILDSVMRHMVIRIEE
ncbi:30S ribosomal protein S6 [Peptoniphilus sp. KCTC 25270]|uniref:30S ribosomal protein S6 n=1 Tax=Peptoniphilus sp. KCTC 25270 TaxID=2897414 RepID=UPI001E61D447|nr:30S ribosomal protein S6 [Peptoniphilus sp. KCTC 25270]MCD1147332.1 30S ribosomal protein S6 [Peptoniphilus sp. KCTC 25270]